MNQKFCNIYLIASFQNKLQEHTGIELMTHAVDCSNGGLLLILIHGSLAALKMLQQPREGCLVWFNWVSWHTNHWRLFNAKSIFIHINSSISNTLV